jgi:hypothetical protein
MEFEMKSVSKLALAAVVAASSLFAVATVYADEQNSTFNFVPPQCAQQATKDANPEWYRDGGYCNPHDYDD